MPPRDVVLVGASAGGIEALRTLVAGLPADLAATVLVVVHVPPAGSNALASILDRAGPLPARAAVDNEPLPRGVVLVATPDHHLVVDEDRVVLSAGPRENGHRPAVDVLFRSAARALGSRCHGVVLSGTLDDGSAGLVTVRARGGLGVVQDPADAVYAGMPEHAIAAAHPEHVVPVAAMAALLAALVERGADEEGPGQDVQGDETAVARFDLAVMSGDDHPGEPSGYSCPDCSGVLWRLEEQGHLRFRCRVGHAWSAQGLLAEQSMTMDSALWIALRSLEEKAALVGDLAHRASAAGHPLSAGSFARRAQDTTEAAGVLRDLLTRVTVEPPGEEGP